MGLNLKNLDLSDLPDQPRGLAQGTLDLSDLPDQPGAPASLSTPQEKAFQSWYAQQAFKLNLASNPDDPRHFYDYRAAFLAGAAPDEKGHWPSQFKLPGHPNRYVDGIDTITGKPVPSLIQTPAPSGFQRAVNFLSGAGSPNRTPAARARAANVLGLAQTAGISPAQAEDHYAEMMSKAGFDPGPSTADLAFFALGTVLTMGAADPAVGAVMGLKNFGLAKLGVGLASFAAVKKAVDKASEIAAKYVPWTTPAKTGEPGGQGLKALLPAHSSETVTGMLDIAEFLVEGAVAGGAVKAAGAAGKAVSEAVMTRVFRHQIEEKGLPRNVWFSADQIRTVFNAPEGKISPEEMDLVRSLGLSAREYHDAMEHGLDITIPAERLVKLVDKPWWARIKGSFRLQPYEEVVKTEPGQAVKIAGRLPAPGEEAPPEGVKAPEKAGEPSPGLSEGEIKPPAEGQPGAKAEAPAVEVPGEAAVGGRGALPRVPETPKSSAEVVPEEFDELAARIVESELKPSVKVSAIAEYEELQAEARARAEKRVPELMEARKLKALKQARVAAKAQAREAIADMPVFQAMDQAVKEGGLNREALLVDYDQATITQLSRKRPGLIRSGGPVRPDSFATQFGFEGSDALVEAMLDAPTKQMALEAAADQAMAAYEDAWTEEAADIALETLEQEINILNEMLGKKRPVAKGIKKFIREETGQVRSGRLVNEAVALREGFKKAAREARNAWREGRRELTLQYKERQRALLIRIRDRYKARDEIRKIDAALNRHVRLNTLPFEYKDQLTALLERYVRIPESFRGRMPEKSLKTFLQGKADAGEEGAQIALSLHDRLPEEQSRFDLTLEEIQVVKDLADILAHLGRTENKLLKAGRAEALQDVLAKVNSTIAQNHPAPPPEFGYTPAPGERRLSWLGNLTEESRAFMAGRVKPEFIVRAMDGWEDLGPVWQELFLPIKQAEDEEMLLGAAKMKALQEAFDAVLGGQLEPVYPVAGTPSRADWEALGPGWADIMLPEAPATPEVLVARRRGLKAHAWANKKYTTPGIPQTLRKEEIVMVALNSGNEGNRAALRGGFRKEDGKGWTDEDIENIVAHLDDGERALVESIWQTIDSLYEPLAETYTALTGARLTRVEGRYFPLVFDRDLAYKADRQQAEADARDFFKTIYTKPKPQDGMTIERKGGRLPPRLSFSVIPKHIQATIHYLTHAIPVRDVSRIVSNDAFRVAVERAPGLGDPAWRQLMPWLQEVARPRQEPLNDIEKRVQWLRRNATVVNMGLKASVAFIQPLAAFQAVPQLGAYAVAKGFSDFYTNPWATRDFIVERSPMMRFRAQQFDRDLNQLFNRFDASFLSRGEEFKRHAFDAIALMDKSATYPVWMAAYDQGLDTYAGDEDQAIQFAEMIVRTTQGTGMPKDLSGWQRGGELAKLFTMFYSFWSVYANQMYELGFRFRMGDASLLDWFKAHMWLTIIPSFIGFVMYERRLPTTKEAAAEMLAYRLSGLPVIRDVSGALFKGYDYRISPVESGPKGALNFISALTKPHVKERGRKIVRYSLQTGGYLTGLPTAQAVITMEGILDLMSGKTSDPTRLLFRESREPKE